MAKKK
jgi:hypothetical protein